MDPDSGITQAWAEPGNAMSWTETGSKLWPAGSELEIGQEKNIRTGFGSVYLKKVATLVETAKRLGKLKNFVSVRKRL